MNAITPIPPLTQYEAVAMPTGSASVSRDTSGMVGLSILRQGVQVQHFVPPDTARALGEALIRAAGGSP